MTAAKQKYLGKYCKAFMLHCQLPQLKGMVVAILHSRSIDWRDSEWYSIQEIARVQYALCVQPPNLIQRWGLNVRTEQEQKSVENEWSCLSSLLGKLCTYWDWNGCHHCLNDFIALDSSIFRLSSCTKFTCNWRNSTKKWNGHCKSSSWTDSRATSLVKLAFGWIAARWDAGCRAKKEQSSGLPQNKHRAM